MIPSTIYLCLTGRMASRETTVNNIRGPSRHRRALSPAQAFGEAVARHRDGRVNEAEQLYRAVLKLAPDHFGAVHYLGLACTQQGELEEAESLLQRAVALDPTSAEARTNLGIALAALRRPKESMAQYEQAIALAPDYADARNNLGIVLQSLQRQEEAAAQFEAALALKPDNAFVLNNLGSALAALGRHDEAMAAYEKALAINPRFPEAVNNLGLSLAALDRQEEAVARFERAIELKPDYAEAHGNLGAALNKLDRHEAAIPHFERALELNSNLAEAHNDIGNALAALERYEEAVERYRRAIAIKPTFAAAHGNIGNALVELDRRDEAIRHFEAAFGLDPEALETQVSLAGALSFVDRHDEAVEHFRAVLAKRPDSAEAHAQLGNALESAGRSEEAAACHRQALAVRPEFAQAHNALGISLISLGRIVEAQRAIERAIELAPTVGHFHRTLTLTKRFTTGDPHLAAMEQLALDPAASPDDEGRMELNFGLGKAYADLDRQADALRHLIDANAVKRKKIKYDEPTALAQFQRIKETMTRELIARKSGHGAVSDVPVFILGMPRSGSTLIEQILASHPQVLGGGELPNFGQAVARVCGGEAGTPARFTEVVPDMPGERLGEIGARYLDSVGRLGPKARRISNKMPANFRLAGLIHLALPGAHIIHSRRDPIDTCLSSFEREFSKNNQNFTYDLAELGRYYRAYDDLMAHWDAVLPPGTILDVQYEELVADFEPQARRIVAFCGLEWDERCLAFHRTERPVQTASAAQVRQPLYRSSVGRWHSAKHLLRPLLDELGIEP
jgi:tetratricopeptide (TPR) repeat protein